MVNGRNIMKQCNGVSNRLLEIYTMLWECLRIVSDGVSVVTRGFGDSFGSTDVFHDCILTTLVTFLRPTGRT